jgi:hypothetical protein
MSNQNYNGWTNKQTWNINLTFEELFRNMCEEQTFDDVDHLAEAFEAIINELEFQELKEGSLAHLAVGELLDKVNWTELAEHYAADFDLFQEEEEESCSAC